MTRYQAGDVERELARVRAACLALPETSERLSHGGPAFFIKGRVCFVMFLDDHHDDGHLAIWAAAPDGVQAEMVETEPERFIRPPYVGHRGWLGADVAELSDEELTGICREAFRTVAPPTVRRLLAD